MKKLFIILLSALSLTAFAQQKKVAVYVMGGDEGEKKVLGSKLVSAIARSEEYSAIERTAAFLAELSKEQNYQRTGAVDDDEISRLGKQFGVQYVCVATVTEAFSEKYLSARLIDVESAQVERTASSSGAIQSLESLIGAANTVSDNLLANLGKKLSNSKKVAVYIVKNNAGKDVGRVLGDKLVAGFTNSGRYIAIERTNGFLTQLSKEQNYQRTGAVDDSDLSRLGKQFGVQYVCVADVADVFGEKFISARLIDVETAEVLNSYETGGAMNSMSNCLKLTNEIASNLSKGTFKEQAEEARLNAEKEARIKKEEALKSDNYIETAWDINMKMIWVEGGEFMMGCTSEQGTCKDDGRNIRRVVVDSFYIGMLEVTQSQWEKVVGTNPSKWRGPNLPVEQVSWNDAMEFCRLLSDKTGKTYTLPTEAQWEYAARGGKKADGTLYAGSDIIDAVAWYTDNSGSCTHPCGTKRANALGIYDMSGNVGEWCKECVRRGGGWCYSAGGCRIVSRNGNSPSGRSNYLGFRVVLIP